MTISSIYGVIFDLKGDGFFAIGSYNEPMACSTNPWKFRSGQSIPHDMSSPLDFYADAGDNFDPPSPPPPPLRSVVCRKEEDDDDNEFDENDAR